MTITEGSLMRLVPGLAAIVLICVAWHASAQVGGDVQEAARIAAAITDLGDIDPVVRDKAMQTLRSMGKAAAAALRRAAENSDPETSARARELLLGITIGETPDTPAEVLKLIRAYRRGDLAQKRQAVQALEQQGEPGREILTNLSRLEGDWRQRQVVFGDLAGRAATAGRNLVDRMQLDEAKRMLAQATLDGDGQHARDYGALLVAMGQLDEAIREHEQFISLANQPTGAAATLGWLYRAKGDLAGALRSARRCDNETLLECILFEQGDLDALAARMRGRMGRAADIGLLGRLAMLERLAGHEDRAVEVISALKGITATEENCIPLATALAMNEASDAANAVMEKGGKLREAAGMLVQRAKRAEAVRLLRSAMEGAAGVDKILLACDLAEDLELVGEREQAEQVIKQHAALLAGLRNAEAYAAVIRAEAACGMEAQALEHCGQGLERLSGQESADGELLAALLPGAFRPEAWLMLVRVSSPGMGIKEALEATERLAEPGVPIAELERAVAGLRRVQGTLNRVQQSALVEHVSSVLATREEYGLALELRRDIDELTTGRAAATALVTARIAARGRKWKALRQVCQRAVDKGYATPSLVYLLGLAESKLGDAERGRRNMELGTLMPLADGLKRLELIQTLDYVEQGEMIARQGELLIRTCDPGSIHDAIYWWGEQRRARIADGQLEQAELSIQRALWVCMGQAAFFINHRGLVVEPRNLRVLRARRLLAQGRVREAVKETREAMRLLPGDSLAAATICPKLLRLGHEEEAERLLAEAMANTTALLERYPRCAHLHNELAWMLVVCRRDLNKALEHAKLGVELAPKNTAIIDTLAEVYFQLGRKDEAMATIRRCIELQPTTKRHRLVLERFEKSGPQTPPPEEH